MEKVVACQEQGSGLGYLNYFFLVLFHTMQDFLDPGPIRRKVAVIDLSLPFDRSL